MAKGRINGLRQEQASSSGIGGSTKEIAEAILKLQRDFSQRADRMLVTADQIAAGIKDLDLSRFQYCDRYRRGYHGGKGAHTVVGTGPGLKRFLR